MKYSVLLLFLLLFVSSARAQTEEELDEVNNRSFEEFEAYNYRTAIDLQHVIRGWNARKHLHSDTNEVAILVNLGGFYQAYQRFDSARYFLEQAQVHCVNHVGKGELYVNVVLQLGGLYDELELLREAEILNEEAIHLLEEEAVSEDPLLIAYIYNNQSIIKRKRFKLKEARILIEKCERYTLRYTETDAVDYAATLNTKGVILGAMGELKTEEEILMRAKTICDRQEASGTSLYATILNNLAVLYSERGDHKKALALYQRSYDIRVSVYSEKSIPTATVLGNWGISLGNSGDYNRGILLINKSRRIVEELLGPYHPDWFEKSATLGSFYEGAGMIREAGELYASLLEQAGEKLGQSDPAYLTIASNAALFYTNREQFDKANECYTVLMKHAGDMGEEGRLTILGNFANFLHQTGRDEEARKLYDEELKGWERFNGKQSQEYLNARHNRAVFLQDKGELELAKKELEETEKLLSETSGEKTPLLLMLRENLAGIYEDQGDHAHALRMYSTLYRVQEQEYGANTLDAADLMSKIAMCHTNLGEPDKGMEWMEKAYALKVELLGKEHPSLSYELTLLATSHTYAGNYKAGMDRYNEAVKLIGNQFSTYFRFMTESEKLRFLNRKMSELKQLQAIAVDKVAEYPALGGLAMDVELMMKGMILESGNRLRKAALENKDPRVRQQYMDLQNLRSQLATELSKKAEFRRDDFADLQKKSERMEKDLVSSLGQGQFLDQSLYSWKDIRKKLAKGEALVEFVSYRTFYEETPSLAALVLKADMESPALIPLFGEAQLQQYLSGFRAGSDRNLVNALYGETRGAGAVPDKQVPVPGDDSLYLYIWKPLEKVLGAATRVYYSPSGSINKISLAALKTPEGTYLSSRYEMAALSSGRMLLDKPGTFIPGTALLLGGARFDMTPGQILSKTKPGEEQPQFVMRGGNGARAWSYLAGTLTEVQDIAGTLKGNGVTVDLKTGEEAYEENVKKSMAQGPSILHLSTHGYFFPEQKASGKEANVYETADNPLLRSGLILSGANTAWTGQTVPGGTDDGILTAYEVAAMDLSNTRLAVLSACETGLGDIRGSEGVFGLQRAFKQAGVEYIVMSLWQVPDQETVEFMNHFYRNLSDGQGIEKAFNAAQASMREKYPPYYWAAFVLIR